MVSICNSLRGVMDPVATADDVTWTDPTCPVARTLDVVGDRWSLLIIRDAMFQGITRFTDFQRNLGIAPNILAKRLAEFVEAGILEPRAGSGGRHAEYVLTPKGRELQPVIVALSEWGDRWGPQADQPVGFVHEECGGRVELTMECHHCGDSPKSEAVLRLGQSA